MKLLCFIVVAGGLMVLPLWSSAQEDSTRVDSIVHVQNLEAVCIQRPPMSIVIYRPMSTILTKQMIEELAPDDAGDLLSKTEGSTVKSYGGLGAMKTLSLRSLGSQHTAILVDGFVLNNTQTGQINLAQIQPEGLISTAVYSVGERMFTIPVSAQVAGGAAGLYTFMNYRRGEPASFRASAKYGSFDRMEGYLGGRVQKEKWSFAAFGKYRTSEGNYPYTVLNGNTLEEGIRRNNDYQDGYFGGQIAYAKNLNTSFRLGYKGALIEQGLPGAVILYNETADERMATQDHTVYGDANWLHKSSAARFYFSLNRNLLNYTDTSYFNNVGGIDVDYLNHSGNAGIVLSGYNLNRFRIGGGAENTLSTLVSSDSAFNAPFRSHSYLMATIERVLFKGSLQVKLAGQHIYETARKLSSDQQRFRFTPTVVYESNEFKRGIKFKAWYRNSFRMPSFNELYYNNIGNQDLLPETAHQFSAGIQGVPLSKNKGNLLLRSNVYYNRVNNKIIAIPTKNLFVWSMQNVTDVAVYGADFTLSYRKKRENWNYGFLGNYTWQKAIDVTPESLNYGDQVAYTPEHTANADVFIGWKELGLRFSNNYVSERYALNENIDPNLVSAFIVSDVAVHYTFRLKKEQTLKLQANVKNVFDQSYAYIRSFVMPGRNYLISLNYAFN